VFKRVLIANRGEIAIRIARAAAGLGVESVSVFAPADALGLHTRTSTQSRAIGVSGGDPVAAYLDIDALIAVAKDTGCDSVHPGYGFLSESAPFARRCQAQGLAFIGPKPETLELFGDKVAARKLAQSLDIPTVPGSPALASAKDAAKAAEAIGYPVMLKASAMSPAAPARRRRRSATARCSSKSWWNARGTSRCRSWPTPRAA
jgi:pyruvate carboxylase